MKILRIPTFAFFGFVIGFPLILSAQEDLTEIPPPKFPIKLRAEENATWTITEESGSPTGSGQGNSADSPKPEPFVKQLVVTKTGSIYNEKATVENGPSWEKWIFLTKDYTYRLIQYSNNSNWTHVADSYYADISRYETSDFEALEWVNKKDYQGIRELNKQPMYFFNLDTQSPVSRTEIAHYDYHSALTGQTSAPHYTYQAWFDTKTVLPVKMDDGTKVHTYTYGPAPTSHLVPPPEVVAELKKWITFVKESAR